MTEDVYYRETLNQGGRGREGGNNCSVNLQGYIDESNLSSPTIMPNDVTLYLSMDVGGEVDFI